MKRTTKLFAIIAMVAALGASGCESEVNLVDNAEPGSQTTTTDDGTDEAHDHIEEPEGTVEAGEMTGSWRVATVTEDAPALYVDLLQAAGESELSGDFKMGPAIVPRLDGQTGPIAEGTMSDGVLTVKFNPTTDPEEVYTLRAATEGDGFKGTVTAKKNTGLNSSVTVMPLATD